LYAALAVGMSSVVVTGTAFVAGGPSAAAPLSMASAITSLPVRPPICTAAQMAATDLDSCAVMIAGTPADHGWPAPPFPYTQLTLTPIPPEQWVPLGPGSRGPIVVQLQRVLRAITPTLPDDGVFGAATLASVQLIQQIWALPVTGIVDATLAQMLNILFNASSKFPPDGWTLSGGVYTKSPVLAAWEAQFVKGTVTTLAPLAPLIEGFLADVRAGTYRIDEVGAYAFRCTATTVRSCEGQDPSDLSYHAWGMAIDMNPTQNPLQTVRHPVDACTANVDHAMPDWILKTAMHWGLFWGGWYSCPSSVADPSISKDPHHFEFRGTPDLAARIIAKNTAPGAVSPARPGIGDLLLSCGDRGPAVAQLRALLPPTDLPPENPAVADTFTRALEDALAVVQTRLGLPTTGMLDLPTAAALGIATTHSEWFPVLKINSCGRQVDQLRRALGLPLTGFFDSSVTSAIRSRQKAAGIGPTGVTDSTTVAVLGLLPSIVPSTPVTTAPPTTTAPTTPPDVAPVVKVILPVRAGDRGTAVKIVQRALTDAGFPVTVNGRWRSVTTRQLKAFQRSRGLKVTSTLTIDAARALGLVPVPKVPTRRGQVGEHVRLVQQALQAAGFTLKADSRFGAATRNALRVYQWRAGIKVTGILDRTTLNSFTWT
jgi:peptidoglycan hydrolase-like protein with peptidoglycan-binding domain